MGKPKYTPETTYTSWRPLDFLNDAFYLTNAAEADLVHHRERQPNTAWWLLLRTFCLRSLLNTLSPVLLLGSQPDSLFVNEDVLYLLQK